MDEYLKEWLLLAISDIWMARHEIDRPDGEVVTIGVCFHAQQAAEKFLKAYLVSRGVDFEYTHELEYLLELCAREDESFLDLDVGNLTDYAVRIRYPRRMHIPSIEEAKKALRLAERIKDFVLEKLGISEDEIS